MDIGPKYQVSNSNLVRIILKDHWTWKIRSWLTCCLIFLFGAIVFCYPTPGMGFSLFQKHWPKKKTFLGLFFFFFLLCSHTSQSILLFSHISQSVLVVTISVGISHVSVVVYFRLERKKRRKLKLSGMAILLPLRKSRSCQGRISLLKSRLLPFIEQKDLCK